MWFRGGGAGNNGRMGFAPGTNGAGAHWIEGFDGGGWPNSAPIDWQQYDNEWVTLTFRLKPSSGTGVSDGIYEAWFNDIQMISRTNVDVGPWPFTGELQLGGPTWIQPQQDQTMYIADELRGYDCVSCGNELLLYDLGAE